MLVVSYASSLRAYLEQRSELAQLSRSIAESKASIGTLQREKQRWKDPAYVRAQARARLGYIMPGQTGFQVIDADGKPLDPSESLGEPPPASSGPPEWYQTAWGSVLLAGSPPDKAAEPKPVRRIVPPQGAGR